MSSIRLTVNGEAVEESVEPRTTLVDFLRETLGLTGSHVGCEHGVCGACTVLVDDVIVRGCLTLAVQCDGARVETIEGVSDSGAIADLQDAFRRRNALQCGFCTPAMLLTAQELLAQRGCPEPRCDPRASCGQLLPLHRLPGDRRRNRIRRAGARKRNGSMNQHMKPQSISQQADELEEEMMHALERVMTQVDAALSRRRRDQDRHQRGRLGEEPEGHLQHGGGPAAAADAGEADADRLFPLPFRLACASAAERDACAQGRS